MVTGLIIGACQKPASSNQENSVNSSILDTATSNSSNDLPNSSIIVHEHTYSSQWSYNNSKHWHAATCGHDSRIDEEEHVWNNVVTEPTYETDGYTTHTCRICGYSFTDNETEMLKHNYSSTWSYNSDKHWRSCVDEGYENLKLNEANHSFVDTIVEPTYGSGGYTKHTCEICNYYYIDNETSALTYTIIWKNYDGTILLSEQYHEGELPIYTGEVPEKQSDAQYTYTFSGWSPTIKEVTANVTYIAQYSTAVNTYTVTWKNDDGSILDVKTYKYGQTPVFSYETPTKEAEDPYYYVFSGWEPAIRPVDGNATYCASFSKEFVYEYTITPSLSDCTITGLHDKLKTSTIPEQIDGVPVTSIADNAFRNQNKLETLTLTNNIKAIGNYSFAECSNLKTIHWSTNLINIGSYAFSNCKSLITIDLPNSVEAIGKGAFHKCSNVYEMTLPFIGHHISSDGFIGHIFGADAYSYNRDYVVTSLKKITVGPTCRRISNNAFFGCAFLEKIIIDSSNISISSSAFDQCASTLRIVLSDSVTDIVSSEFAGCQYINEVVIPDAVTSIGSNAFSGCSALSSVTIGNGVTTICDYAFSNCSSLTSIVIPDSVTSIGKQAFFGCSALSSVTIGNGVTTICDNAFNNCSSLKSLILPGSVTTIGLSAFSSKTTINYSGSLDNWMNVVGKKNILGDVHLYLDSDNQETTSITIPTGVVSINSYEFSNCSSLSSVTIPDSVTSIGDRAFFGCASLTSITVPDSVSLIGNGAFYNCSSLTSITLPFVGGSASGNQFLGYIFGASSSSNNSIYVPSLLETVIISNQCTSIGQNAFSDCTSLRTITIGENVSSIQYNAFSNCTSLEIVNWNAVNCVANGNLFDDCTSLCGINISSDVITIPSTIFTNLPETIYCEYLNALYLGNENNPYLLLVKAKDKQIEECNIHEGCKYIGYSAFSDCTALTTIRMPDSVVYIGQDAFKNCSSLEYFDISKNTNEIGSYAFYRCSSLTSMIVPDSTISIGDYAFNYCSSLTKLSFGNGVVELSEGLLNGCSSLKELTLPFIGKSSTEESESKTSEFGYIFGRNYFDNSVKTDQYYNTRDGYGNPTDYISYYIPYSLKIVSISKGTISFGAFYNCRNIAKIILGNDITSIDWYAFCNCTSLNVIVVGPSVESIRSNSFKNCSYLYEVVNESSLTCSAGDGVFPSSIKQVISQEDDSIVSFNDDGFITYDDENGTVLIGYADTAKEIVLPNYVTKIGNGAFSYDTRIESITIPDNVTSIGSSAFEHCDNLHTVDISDSITSIPKYAFHGCSQLYSVVIGKNVASIDYSFYGCSLLKKVFYKGTSEDWEQIEFYKYPSTVTDYLSLATHYFYSETEPTESGNYWHYVDGEPTIW